MLLNEVENASSLSPRCSSKVGARLLDVLHLRRVCSHAQELDAKVQGRKFPYRAFVLNNGTIGPGRNRPHGSKQAGLSIASRCADPTVFAPLPRSYASMVSRLVKDVGRASAGSSSTCADTALVIIEPPDLWNIWWVLVEAVTAYALLTALLPAVLPQGMQVQLARVVEDKRAHAAGDTLFAALFSSQGTALNLVRAPPTRPECYRRLILLPHENPWILQNGNQGTSHCFSPIVSGFAQRLMSVFADADGRGSSTAAVSSSSGAQPTAAATTATWCWMFRSEKPKGHWVGTQAQRVVLGQKGMLERLAAKAPSNVQAAAPPRGAMPCPSRALL